jgi:peptide/nickel transport system substrate-binding protein
MPGRAFASVLLALLCAACTVAPTAPTAPAAPTASAGRDTLAVAITADAGSAGFNRPGNIAGRRASLALFNGLFEWSYDDPTAPLTVVPGLATSWDLSADGTTYTFHLRKDVKFHDGTPFDADAVVFNFQMLTDKSFPYYDATGAAALAGSLSGPLIQSYRAVDPSTFELILKQPSALLLDEWSQPGLSPTWIVSPAAVKQYGVEGLKAHPIGTGPFKLDSYKPGESIVFSRNDSYFRGPAAYRTLVWRIITDPAARAAAVEAGEVQIAESIAVQYRDQWRGRTDLAVQVTSAPNSHACWLNATTGPMVSTEFRRAVSLALNRPQINQLAMGGVAAIPSGYLAPGVPAFSAADPPLASDTAAAAGMLDKLGLKGARLTYETTTALGEPAVWEVMNRNLSEAGLAPIQRVVDLATWLGDYTRLPTAGLDMACGQMGSDSMLQIYTLLRAGGWPPNPTLDAAYNTLVMGSRTLDDYLANLRSVNTLLAQDFVAIFVITSPKVNGISTAVDWLSTPTYAHSFYKAHFK